MGEPKWMFSLGEVDGSVIGVDPGEYYNWGFCNLCNLLRVLRLSSQLMIKRLKTYQFKTPCKGDSHSSKTANIILPGLMIIQR